jgi:hypothetical protein
VLFASFEKREKKRTLERFGSLVAKSLWRRNERQKSSMHTRVYPTVSVGCYMPTAVFGTPDPIVLPLFHPAKLFFFFFFSGAVYLSRRLPKIVFRLLGLNFSLYPTPAPLLG